MRPPFVAADVSDQVSAIYYLVLVYRNRVCFQSVDAAYCPDGAIVR